MKKGTKQERNQAVGRVQLAEFPDLAAAMSNTKQNFFAISRKTKKDRTRLMHDLAIDLLGMNDPVRVIFVDLQETQDQIKEKLAKSIHALSDGDFGREDLKIWEDDGLIEIFNQDHLTDFQPKARDLLGYRLLNLLDSIMASWLTANPCFLLINNPEGILKGLWHDALDARFRFWNLLNSISGLNNLKIVTTLDDALPESSMYSRSEKQMFKKMQDTHTVGTVEQLRRRVGKVQLVDESGF